MKFAWISIISLALSACSTTPKAMVDSAEATYEIVSSKSLDNFVLRLNVDPNITELEWIQRATVAVGDECAILGFNYFDLAREDYRVEGFCFKSNSRQSLAITFAPRPILAEKQSLIVESLNSKSTTLLVVGDQILQTGRDQLLTISKMKSRVFHAALPGQKMVPLKVRRAGRVIQIEEPMATLANGALGPEDLQNVRKKLD